jgi:hypothetical protein
MYNHRVSLLVLPWLLALVAGCDKGDYFPPERAFRAAFNGWDMWDTAAVSPYKAPMPAKPEGVIPVNYDKDAFATARAKVDGMNPQTRKLAQATAYGRYCSHCHGEHGDNRTIVGESFTPRLPDLRLDATQAKSDRQLFHQIMHGSAIMVALDDTVTPVEAVLAIDQVRTLAGAPSRPLFAPKSTKPIR